MDWLKKLPGIGPVVTRLMTTHAWRSYERLDRVKWTRLAAAMTFISFVALFPLITVAAALAAATLDENGQRELEDKIAEQIPGISEQLDIGGLVNNAGTVGVIAGAVLLFTGIGWVGSMRECLRAVWELPEPDENPVLRKAKDAGVLVGLGGAVLVSIGASAVAATMVGWTARQLGIDEAGWGGALLQTTAFAIAVLADFLLLLYVLTLLPGVEPTRRRLFTAALLGAAGFELLKLLISGYMKGVASKNMYGAFGVPVALLLWINFTAKLVLFCAAWTATRKDDSPDVPADDSTENNDSEGNDSSRTTEEADVSGAGGAASGRAAATGG
ncbi:YihY/virulence factor BrkB family protein [Streptomyces sp. HC44]|uniref:YihY/virulence factor BrkB family protein n=1 Tax=Streptomyces scabichelini TaxID=2711217 RepID=A0A6G4VJ59_9ACTN|nr:YihY/virulence factor BrkB family protein [Streptomyces scabichelini]NGO14192.1 YihY/virulence factor BrkB family protein [Streptomyces scabichelini]